MSVRTSLAWSYGGQAFTFLVTFASSVIVARLLGPREMGIFAIAMATSGFLSVFTSLSIGTYLVREGELTKTMIRSVYTVNMVMSLLMTLLMLAAGTISIIYTGEREIGVVLIVSSIGPILGIFEFLPATLYTREMNYGMLTRVGMIRTVIIAVVVVSCAYEGLGSLSPAIGPLVAGVFSTIYYNIRRRRDIILCPTGKGLKPIIMFGFQMMSISGVAQLAQNLCTIILGRMLGLAALGLYNRASSLSGLIWSNVYGLATGVIFVKLSNDLREKGTLHETFLRSMRMITAVIWPVMIGVAVLARPVVYVLYGERWLGAAAPLTLLMIGLFVALGFGMNWELFVLRRETALQTRFEFIRAGVGLIAFTVGSAFNITAAAAGRLVEAIIGYLLYRPHIDRMAGVEHGELERIFSESLALTVVAIAPAFLLMLSSGWAADTSPLRIAAAVALGVGCWFALLIMRAHPVLAELHFLVAKVRSLRA